MTQARGVSIPVDQLSDLVARLLAAAGIPERAARTTANALVDADLEGISSHGVMLMDLYIDRIRKGSVSTEVTATVVSDNGAAVVLDAHHALGQSTADQAMQIAIARARRYGTGITAVRHAFHFGTARRYAIQAADADCIGICMCNTRPLMPAPGGAEALVGNNPLAIAFPTDGPVPIVLDMATSEAAMGKIRMAQKAGESIPETWAVKSDGSATTSPSDAIAGMLLPVGGPKGFGLAVVIDLLCGHLSGGASGSAVQPLYGDAAVPYDCSHLFIAIDIAHFADPATVRRAAATAADRIRGSKRAAGVPQLFAPGEPEWRFRERAAGRIELAPTVSEMLTRLARELGVSPMPLAPNTGEPMEETRHAQA